MEHYIDDFITLGRPRSNECQAKQCAMLETCKAMGVPIEAEKSEGRSILIMFLGIELDSNDMEMRLPPEKFSNLRKSRAA